MIKYADLYIKCDNSSQVESLKKAIITYCSQGYALGFSLHSFDGDWLYLKKEATIHHPKVRLAICSLEDNRLSLANIVPDDSTNDGLDKDQYNSIVDSFYNVIALPVCGANYKIIKPNPDVKLESLLPKSFQSLLFWERGIDRRSPFNHPLDLNRWFSFIYSIVSNQENLSVGDFQLWLHEDCGWSNRDAYSAAIRYESDLQLADYIITKHSGK